MYEVINALATIFRDADRTAATTTTATTAVIVVVVVVVVVMVVRGAARLIQSAGDLSSLIKAPCPAMDQSAAW